MELTHEGQSWCLCGRRGSLPLLWGSTLSYGHDPKELEKFAEQVKLEQFITWHWIGTATCLQCHQPKFRDNTIYLAENHMCAFTSLGSTSSITSTSLKEEPTAGLAKRWKSWCFLHVTHLNPPTLMSLFQSATANAQTSGMGPGPVCLKRAGMLLGWLP